MSYQFIPGQHYRMPTHFGPSLGPRQGVNGRRFHNIDTPHYKVVSAAFLADKSQLEKLLPPGFILRGPGQISFTFEYITKVEWLAGRGYNTFGVSIPVTYIGEKERVDGDFLLVLWENKADPIITGREDLGFAKIYAEIPEPQALDKSIICRASWDGFEFANLQFNNLKHVSPEQLPDTGPSAGTLHYKYIPKTWTAGESDVQYAVLTPEGQPNTKIEQTLIADNATITINEATWEQLPTLVNIVNTLSELSIGECVSTFGVEVRGGKDLSDQRILR